MEEEAAAVEQLIGARLRRGGFHRCGSEHENFSHGRNVVIDYIVAMGYIMDMKQITYTRAAIKVLARMPANTSALIRAKITQYAADPASVANNVRALTGRDGIRLRVGNWRVIMVDGEVLAVLEVGPRGGIYD